MKTKHLLVGAIFSGILVVSVVLVYYSGLVDTRPERFPVGHIQDVTFDEDENEVPLVVYYPAIENGENTVVNDEYKYPAIVFLHGFMAAGMYSWVCNYTVSHGYVVVAPEFSTFNILQILPRAEAGVKSVIDYIFIGMRHDIQNTIDLDKIGIVGHSLGATIAFGGASGDDRVRAVVSVAPFYNEIIWSTGLDILPDYVAMCANVTAPTQIIAASEDSICPPDSIKTSYYDTLPVTKEFLIINGSGHILGLVDVDMGADFMGGIFSGMMSGLMGTKEHRDIALRYMMSWLDYFLYDNSEAHCQLFGECAQADLDNRILTELSYEREQNS